MQKYLVRKFKSKIHILYEKFGRKQLGFITEGLLHFKKERKWKIPIKSKPIY